MKKLTNMNIKEIFYFGESVDGYDRLVLNEREARAGAGILFLFAFFSFLHAYNQMDFHYTKIFVTFFMLDFIIRILINPKYSPSLIAGRLFVSNQKPEYVSATPKRFAWSIGLILSIVMFIIVVILEMMVTIRIAICFLCLFLLYFESVFGICIGCIIYYFFTKKTSKYCPGGVCDIKKKDIIQEISLVQILIVVSSLAIASYYI
ncbi:MAG: DUF4395 domain-containing protein [Candidatus Marithrix sp.]